MMDHLRRDLGLLEPSVYALLSVLESGNPTETELRTLLSYSKQLGALAHDSDELKSSLDQLLMSDEDMAALYLTDTRNGVGHVRLKDHHEMEILLENYARRLEETANRISELQGKVCHIISY